MLASPRREFHTPAIARLFPNTRLHSPGKRQKGNNNCSGCQGEKKNLSFSNNLLIFSEEHARLDAT